MSDIDYKKKTLEKLGIRVFDGSYKNIFLKYKKTTIPYDTQSFLMYNANYLITDICKLFEIDNMEDNFLKNLGKKKEYLKKLRINKVWFNEDFYLEKDKVMIKYDFDDYIDMEPDLFIADVKNKFNKIDVKTTFNDTEVSINKLPFKTETEGEIIIDINQMKLNIKNILKQKGLIVNE